MNDIPYQELPITGQFSIFPLETCVKDLTREPHRHDHFQVIWFKKGKGKHVVDFVEYALEDDVIYLLRPGQVHQLLDCLKIGHVVVFTEKFYFSNSNDRGSVYDFTSLFDDSLAYGPVKISESAATKLESLCHLMADESALRPNCNRNIMKHYLNAFLLLIEREKKLGRSTSNSKTYDARMVELRRIMEQHFRQQHQVTFYAENFALTPKRLNEIVKESIGKTLSDMLHDRLVLEAKRQLAYSHRSVKEICYELGFEDPAYFSRFFRNHTGSSPQDFRETMFK
ncbi:AraC-like DNA-binding protein [Chitinophaga skermanii]|uniref:AraC-like DNA-binding protein n=1 Tax=Chitinophaga skermanii TaxID=331697 RepID=A0A327Q117_9BACT|nr:helix-turn-helix domain-containing protein [Chitinophaga skermanii]RAI97447.1 AraC-like DNA-binding protein [Chitinophaga skermanii]